MTASLLGPVRTHRRRRERPGDGSFLHSVALVGAIGWLIVVPTVAGAFVGRFLDHRLATGILFSAALIGLGAAMGSWAAWRRVWR